MAGGLLMRRLIEVDGQQVEADELLDARTAHAKHFALPDGRRVAIIQQGQHYHDRDTGGWEDCDNSVVADARPDGFSVAVSRAPLRARFGPRGRHRIGFGIGQYITLSAANVARVVPPAVEGCRVTYADLWPSADLIYEHRIEGLKELIRLRDHSAPTSFAFRVAEAGGVTLRQAEDGGIEVLDAGGTVLGKMLAPWCEDATGARGSAALSYDGTYIVVTPDPAWLADPERAWPVVVDPTVVIQPDPTAGIDAYVSSYSSNTNYGNATDLWVGAWNSGGTLYRLRSLAKFPFSGIPANATVTDAVVSLYTFSTDAMTVGVHKVTADWSETGVTWNNQPSHDGTALASTSLTGTGWVSWSSGALTTLVAKWVTGVEANYGLKWVSSNEGAVASRSFLSSDYTSGPSLRPKITVTYDFIQVTVSSPSGTQASPTIINDDLTPVLSGVYNPPAAYNMAYRRHWVYDELGNLVWDSGQVAQSATPGSTVSVQVPPGYLYYGFKGYWVWQAWDVNGAYSSVSAQGWFVLQSTSAPQPNYTDGGNPISWEVVLGPTALDTSHEKRLYRVDALLSLGAGASANLYAALDENGPWQGPKQLQGGTEPTVARVSLPLSPEGVRQGRVIRVRVTGQGYVELHDVIGVYRVQRR